MSSDLETRAGPGVPRWLAGVTLAWLALAPPGIAGGMAGPQGPAVLRSASQARPKPAEPGAGVPDAGRAEEAPKVPDSGPVGLPAGGSATRATRPPNIGVAADPASLDDVLRLHTKLAAGARGLAPSPETRLAPDAFRAADQDGDGLLSREEFVVGYHKQTLDSGRSPAPDLAAEATRLAALSRARRAMASRGEPAGSQALEGAGQAGRPPMLPVRTLIPGTPSAAPAAPAAPKGAPTRVDEGRHALGAPPGERAAPPAKPSAARPVGPPEPSGDRRGVSPIPAPPLTKPGRSPAGERPVSVAPPAPVRPPRP